MEPDFRKEVEAILADLDNVYHQIGAVLRDLDMILDGGDIDPPDESNRIINTESENANREIEGDDL